MSCVFCFVDPGMRKMDVRQAVQSPSGGLRGALGGSLAAFIGFPGGSEESGWGSGAEPMEDWNEELKKY